MLRGLIPPYLFMRDPDSPKPTLGPHRVFAFGTEGLTKREYFAALAMQGILTGCYSQKDCEEIPSDWLSEQSVQYADALIDQLNQGESNV